MQSPRLERLVPSFLALLSFAAPAAAQAGFWSDEYDAPGLLGRVFAVGEFQGELVAGGLGVEADGQEFGNLARWDGHRWRELGGGIHGFVVETLHLYQGELVAAGVFEVAGGVLVKSIASWDGAQWRPLGGGLDLSFAPTGTVFALAEFQGELYAAGRFDLADGLPVSNVARWDGAQWRGVGSGIDGDVFALEAGADGLLYAAGCFATAGGVGVSNIAAWDGAAWSAVGAGLGAAAIDQVRALEWHDSRLWGGGYFDVPGGPPMEKLASWNGTAWQAEGNFPDSAIGTFIQALQSLGAELYVGGSIVSVDGIDVDRIARRSGTQWTSIGGVSGLGQMTIVLALGVHAGELAAGGNFSQAGLGFAPGQPVVTNSIAAFDGAQWKQVGKGLGFNASVGAAELWNGAVVAGGSFTEAGRSFAPGVARFDGSDWQTLGALDARVDDITVFQGELVVAGPFGQVDGQPMPGVAAFDGNAWHGFGPGGFGGGHGAHAVAVYQGQLHAGGIGGVQRWNGAAWESFAPQIFGSVSDLHVHGGVLYISGIFTALGGHIVSWDGTTQQIVGGGMDDSVDALESFGTVLLAGGTFTQAGGAPAHRLAQWDGVQWSEFPGVTGEAVVDLAVMRGELFAAGNTLLAPPVLEYIARWDGAQWQPLGSGLFGPPLALLADDFMGKLHAGGSFLEAGGKPALNFSAWISTDASSGAAYCQPGTTTNGCAARIRGVGVPSVSASSGFTLEVRGLEGNKLGLILYGIDGPTAIPWSGGTSTLCLLPPVQRLPPQLASGASGTCQGLISADWNAWRAQHPAALGAPFSPGQSVWAQGWFRDPPAPGGSNLSNALVFVAAP